MNKKRVLSCMLLFIFFMGARDSFAASSSNDPFQETVRILENWTSFHWGRDCLVWVVHYPQELIDPWVDSEAGRTGMTDSERKAYKEGFVAELKMDSAEPFLFTVYAFGPRPLSFSPFAEKVALVTSSGSRVKPIRYDGRLDQPIAGIVQGLVFFPKQRDKNFALAVQGMGVYDERIFAFTKPPFPLLENTELANSAGGEEDAPVVVVELPSPPSKNGTVKKVVPQLSIQDQIKQPQVKVIERPQKQETGVVVIEPEADMTEFVDATRAEGSGQEDAEQADVQSDKKKDAENSYVSREKTIKTFLALWTEHDTDKMYAMLSSDSQKLFSKESFSSDLKKASDFRAALKDGYKIDWLGDERAKVVAAKRMLMIRTLTTRTLGVVRENSSWKIVW